MNMRSIVLAGFSPDSKHLEYLTMELRCCYDGEVDSAQNESRMKYLTTIIGIVSMGQITRPVILLHFRVQAELS